jgi:Fur family ferric uptake transcriptional regulator
MKKTTKESLFGKMKEHKMKQTRQRENIIDALLSTHQPQTAESLLAKLKKSKDSGACDLVTVYRTLHQFEKINLVQKSFFTDNSAQYCINDLEHEEHHHHFQCKKCHRITEIDLCGIDTQTKLLEKKGFRDISHRLEFFGLCPQCAA